MTADVIQPASFRDPDGFIFIRDHILYRQVNKSYQKHYELLMTSGLYDHLVKAGLLIAHDEIDITPAQPDICYRILKPVLVPFISYPYEWCFSQLKDAALVTLSVQKTALEYGLTLKDASAYNVQFYQGRPLMIDTLSFETYVEGIPWVAYRQFCQHFLAPLVLMKYGDIHLGMMLRNHIDGLPLDLTSRLLPFRTWFRFDLLMHIHLHAKSQKHYEVKPRVVTRRKMSLTAFKGLVDNLESYIKKLSLPLRHSQWSDYYDHTNYTIAALEHKLSLVEEFLEQAKPTSVWDLGANIGRFSRLAAARNITTIAFDMDPYAVEKNYLTVKAEQDKNILPLMADLTNPSPGLGWENHERQSLIERGPVDAIMALALIHHLAVTNNLPLEHIARFLSNTCRWLIIEFIPKSDSQVIRLLAARKDIFENYNRAAFESTFSCFFTLERSETLLESERILYLMRKK